MVFGNDVKLLTEGSGVQACLGMPSTIPGSLFLLAFVKTADAAPERQHWYGGPHQHPFLRAQIPTVGFVGSLMPETNHRKDSLHIPDHNIVLGEPLAVDALSMGELGKHHSIRDITQFGR